MVKSIIALLLMDLLLVACTGTSTPVAETEPQAETATLQVAEPTETPLAQPTATATLSPTPTQTATSVGVLAPTDTPTATATHTPLPSTLTPTPLSPTSTPTATPTPTPAPTATPTIDCPVLPAGSFHTVWQSNPALQSALGCPTSLHPRIVPDAWEVQTSYQPFEHGAMIWSDHMGWYAQPVVYVLYDDATYQRFEDTFDSAVDPVSGGETPPNGLMEPIFGFGKVWRDQPGVRQTLGWATAGETPGEGRFQMFVGGDMVWISQTGQTYMFSGHVLYVFDIPFSGE